MGNNSAPLGTIIKHNEEPGLTQSTQEKGENTANISSTKETVKTYNAFTSFILSKFPIQTLILRLVNLCLSSLFFERARERRVSGSLIDQL